MVGRRVMLLGNGNYEIPEGASFEVPYVEETKSLVVNNLKTYEHATLVFIIRFFIQSKNLLRSGIEGIKEAISKLHFKLYPNGELIEKLENSKFLKMIARYRRKIIEITHQVKKEEKNM